MHAPHNQEIKFNASLLYVATPSDNYNYVHSKKIKFNASIMLMHRLILSRFVTSVVSYIFLCTPDNSTMQCPFHWLFLHSNSGTTENMFHIQPCYAGTQASCMCRIVATLHTERCPNSGGTQACYVQLFVGSNSRGIRQKRAGMYYWV